MTPMGIKIYLYFIVYIINAPLPRPSITTTRGKTQHKDAINAEGRLTNIVFIFDIFIISNAF